jgi:glycosyltransferase involved in cell wall biosynthesis
MVTSTYPPVIGGAEMDTQRVAAELIRRGYPVRVLCQGGDPMPAQRHWRDDAGVPVEILTRRSGSDSMAIVYAMRVAWRLFTARRHYQIAFFSMTGLYLAAGLPVCRLLGKRILMKVHGSTVIPRVAASRVGRLELRWLEQWASRVMVLNDEMMQEGLDAGLSLERLMHMPNPIDTDLFCPADAVARLALRAERGIPDEACVLLYTGRLSGEKGLQWLLEAFAPVAAEQRNAMLILLGDGPIRKELEQHAKSLGVPATQIRFAGRVPAQQVPGWLQAADAFALVSPNEGFSCALAEAMSVGLPAVVSAIPANTQLIEDGTHGFSAPPGDIASTTAAIRKLLGDAAARQSMGATARQRVLDNYSLGQIVDRYEELFAKLILN